MKILRDGRRWVAVADASNKMEKRSRYDEKKRDPRLAHIFYERPPSDIADWRGGWIAKAGSEGTRPAMLLAVPVPERWNVKLVVIEIPNGQRLTARAC